MSHDPILEPNAVPGLGAFRLLDARERAPFEAGHPHNAIRVPIEDWEAAAKSHATGLENTAHWAQTIAALGVDNEFPAVIYDDGRLTEAARVWFVLQYFGAQAFMLNGGWSAVERHSVLFAAAQPPGTAKTFHATPGAGSVGLVDRQALKTELGSDTRIFDARTAGEFAGQDRRRNARGGHLPGARLLPHASLLDGDRVKSAEALHRLLAEAGFQPGDHVVTHCDGGGRAALAAAAAVRAGYDDVRAYYLSFSDWAKDESCPIERP